VKPKEKVTMKRTIESQRRLYGTIICVLTDEADTSIGSSLALFASGGQERSNDAHADSGTSNTSEQELSSADVINNGRTYSN
jgi:hypothetical protein